MTCHIGPSVEGNKYPIKVSLGLNNLVSLSFSYRVAWPHKGEINLSFSVVGE